jgi:hypothetical protein
LKPKEKKFYYNKKTKSRNFVMEKKSRKERKKRRMINFCIVNIRFHSL